MISWDIDSYAPIGAALENGVTGVNNDVRAVPVSSGVDDTARKIGHVIVVVISPNYAAVD